LLRRAATTVGYGDVYPQTVVGRIVAAGIMLCGIGLVAIPSGLLASAMTEIRANDGNRVAAETRRRRVAGSRRQRRRGGRRLAGPAPRVLFFQFFPIAAARSWLARALAGLDGLDPG
jgi:hypothetical protein